MSEISESRGNEFRQRYCNRGSRISIEIVMEYFDSILEFKEFCNENSIELGITATKKLHYEVLS